MKHILLIFTLCTLLACSKVEDSALPKSWDTTALVLDSMLLKQDAEPADIEDGEDTQLNFIVSVAEGYNYDSLRNIALQTAGLLHFKFDTLDRYYHPTRGIILPDDHEDDMWAGQYLFRRFGDDVVSIEMRHVYIDTALHNEMEKEKFYADTTKMFVFAMMYPERSKADSLAQQLKPNFASTKVIAAKIYMGCLH